MDTPLVAFVAGFAVCAIGIGTALVFDITLTCVTNWWRRVVYPRNVEPPSHPGSRGL
jgi:hypothetical protein